MPYKRAQLNFKNDYMLETDNTAELKKRVAVCQILRAENTGLLAFANNPQAFPLSSYYFVLNHNESNTDVAA